MCNYIKLKGLNKKGKELIKKYGNLWEIHLTNPEGDLCVISEALGVEHRYCRWIKLYNDPVFEVLNLKENKNERLQF